MDLVCEDIFHSYTRFGVNGVGVCVCVCLCGERASSIFAMTSIHFPHSGSSFGTQTSTAAHDENRIHVHVCVLPSDPKHLFFMRWFVL